MSAPSKEEIDRVVALSEEDVAGGDAPLIRRVIVALTAEVERLRAERAEVLALLEESSHMLEQADGIIRESDDGLDGDEDGYAPLIARINAKLAKLRGAP